MLTYVAQSDACRIGDQVAIWSRPGLATFCRGDWSWSIFNSHSFPPADSRRTLVNFWRKNVQKNWLTTKRTNPA